MVKRNNYKKWIWWGVGLVVVVGMIIGVVIGINSNSKNQMNEKKDEGTQKIEQKDEAGQNEKTESEKKDEEVAKQQTPIQYEGNNPNEAEELSGVITYAEINGVNLIIRTSIDQYLTEGICELTLMRGGNIIYSDTANIVGDVSTATCQGFDVATAELGEGNLEIIINLSANGKRGTIRGEANT